MARRDARSWSSLAMVVLVTSRSRANVATRQLCRDSRVIWLGFDLLVMPRQQIHQPHRRRHNGSRVADKELKHYAPPLRLLAGDADHSQDQRNHHRWYAHEAAQ